MVVYAFVIVWSLICGTFVLQNKSGTYENNRKYYMLLVFGLLAIIMGFRDLSVGQDTMSYKNTFDLVASLPLQSLFYISSFSSKIGYILFMKFCSYIINDYFFFQIIIAGLFCYGMAKFLLKHCKDMLFVTMVFLGCGFYFSSFNVARETFAVMLVLNAFCAMKEQRWKNMIILFILAILVHLTSVIFIWAFVVYRVKDNDFILKVSPIFTLIIGVMYEIIIEIASEYIPVYFNYYKNNKTTHTAGGVIIIWSILVIFSLYCIYEKKRFSSEEKVYANLSLIYVMANVVGLYFNYFQRLGTYFLPFSIILLERVGLKFSSQQIRILYKMGVWICYLAYFFLSARSNQYQYEFFF